MSSPPWCPLLRQVYPGDIQSQTEPQLTRLHTLGAGQTSQRHRFRPRLHETWCRRSLCCFRRRSMHGNGRAIHGNAKGNAKQEPRRCRYQDEQASFPIGAHKRLNPSPEKPLPACVQGPPRKEEAPNRDRPGPSSLLLLVSAWPRGPLPPWRQPRRETRRQAASSHLLVPP